MKYLISLVLIYNIVSCSVSPLETQSNVRMENIYFSFNRLKKAYLDTSRSGVHIEVMFHDSHLAKRDSVKFYFVPIDDNFNHLGKLQRLAMISVNDTIVRRNIIFSTQGIELPISFRYEIGVIYMSPPVKKAVIEWELDTVINDYFTFNVYDNLEKYQQVVDEYGSEPTIFIRE